jgi:nicotinamidase-related amidase
MTTALLIMDVQNLIVSRIEQSDQLLANLQQSIAAARKAKIPVFYVSVKFREGFPEVSDDNKTFSTLKSTPAFASPEATAIHPAVQPQPQDVCITKRRVSAFTGSDLEVVLRAGNIRHLVLTGIATSGVVLSTLREAADKDFKITVLEDCCADSDKEVHDVLLKKVFPRQATVINFSEWIGTLHP